MKTFSSRQPDSGIQDSGFGMRRHSSCIVHYALCLAAAVATLSPILAAFGAEITGVAPDGLAAAIAGANDGDVIVLDATTYTLADELTISSEITIRGASIDRTIIRQTTSNKRVAALDNEHARIEHCTITGGKFTSERGRLEGAGGIGILITANGGTLSHCRITGNVTTCNHNRGIGIDMRGTKGVVSHCVVDNNTYSGGTNGSYGGIHATGGLIEWTLVCDNAGQNCGGIYIAGPVAIVNCTVAGNRTSVTTGGSGGLFLGATSGMMTNVLVAANKTFETDTARGRPEWGGSQSALAVVVNSAMPATVTPPTATSGAWRSQTPAFADAAGGDYHQRLVSPTRDIGCYVFDETALACDFTLSASGLVTGGTLSLSAAVCGATGGVASYAWTVTQPNGATVSLSGASPTFSPTQAGYHDVALAVEDGTGATASFSLPAAFVAAPGRAEVSTTAGLVAALALAQDGCTVACAAGEYAISSELFLTNAVTLTGAGYGTTTIRQTATTGRCVTVNNAGAVLEGFTLTGAKTSSEGVHGLGVKVGPDGGTVRNCRITGNTHGKNWTHGIGVYMIGPGLVTHCVIDHNTRSAGVNQYGGGVYASAGVVDNCLVYANSHQQGGGLYLAGSADVRNCTVVANTATGSAGGVYLAAGGVTVRNCVFWGNASADTDSSAGKPEWNSANTTIRPTLAACAFPTGTTTNAVIGGNCLLVTPAFAAPEENDYHVPASSPLVNNGVSYAGLSATDLDGNARLQGPAPDIGCYEADLTTFTCALSLESPDAFFLGGTATLTASVSGLAEGAGVAYAWTLVNRETGAETTRTGTPLSFTPPACGHYDVTLAATSEGRTAEDSRAGVFYAAPATLHVVPPSAESAAAAAFPHDAWANAATNVQDAVDLAIDGATILLAPGDHLLRKQLNVAKNVDIIGSGVDVSRIRQTVNRERVLRLNAAGARLSRLTLCGFRSDGEPGVYVNGRLTESYFSAGLIIEGLGGTVEDCRITDNKFTAASVNQAYGVGIKLTSANAVVRRCLIDRNAGTASPHGNVGAVYATGGLVEDCVVCFNTNYNGAGIALDYVAGASSRGTARNCTVFGNVATHVGGGLSVSGSGATVENSVFFGNSDSSGSGDTMEWTVSGVSGLVFRNNLLPAGFSAPAGAVGTVFGDPLLRNPASGDFSFPLASPCRDAGADLGYAAGHADFLGNRRRVGKAVDIGAVECQAKPMTLLELK